MEGAGKAVWGILAFREQSPLSALSSFSLTCSPDQLVLPPAGQSRFRPHVQSSSSRDTALAGLCPFLCLEPQFCIQWSSDQFFSILCI